MMDAASAIDLCRATLMSAVVIAAPMLIVGMAAGLLVGLLQALTQIQDQTVAFVPKILAIFLTGLLVLPFMIATLVGFGESLFRRIALLG